MFLVDQVFKNNDKQLNKYVGKVFTSNSIVVFIEITDTKKFVFIVLFTRNLSVLYKTRFSILREF
jgi:hypothetical protein